MSRSFAVARWVAPDASAYVIVIVAVAPRAR
jgi:hypothetical protein